ncbi:hypothetical protein [Marinobacterium aestuariivivens]|uniref:Uncharacterized protein n=1 Tax=Marinobacterium aestuariivivens TaxID=1698799 RepID=A0ABW2A3Z4_9GAMM
MTNDRAFTKVQAEDIRMAVARSPAIAGVRSRGRIPAPLDAAADSDLSREVLANSDGCAGLTEWVAQLSDGLARLGRAGGEMLMIDLTLPGDQRIAAFNRLFQAAPGALVLIHLNAIGPVDPAVLDPLPGPAPSVCLYRLELTWLDSRQRLAVSSLPIPV